MTLAANKSKLTSDEMEFTEKCVGRVVEYGFGKMSTSAELMADTVLVQKTNPERNRFSSDYRPVNATTIPMK